MKDSAKTITNVVDTEDRSIAMVIIMSATGKMTRKMDGARRSMSKQAKLRKEIGKMENLRLEKNSRYFPSILGQNKDKL